jgi:hypothetical protein
MIFEVHLLHRNWYNKHRKEGTIFEEFRTTFIVVNRTVIRIYGTVIEEHSVQHLMLRQPYTIQISGTIFEEMHSGIFLKEICSNFSKISL